MAGLQNLDPTPWLIETDEAINQAYAAMRTAEDEWLAALKHAGARVEDMRRRRHVALVPDAVALPDATNLEATRRAFRSAALEAAERQSKKTTVASRSTELPEWLGPGGGDIHDERPEYRATRVRYRENMAWRGGRITPEEALRFIDERIASLEDAVDRAESRKDSKERRASQRERLKNLKESRRIVRKYAGAAASSAEFQYAARIRSGVALRLSIYGHYPLDETPVSAQAALPAVGLIPVLDLDSCLFEPAGTRDRAGEYEIVAEADPIVIFARRIK